MEIDQEIIARQGHWQAYSIDHRAPVDKSVIYE